MSSIGLMMGLERIIDKYSGADGIHVTDLPGVTCLKYSRAGSAMPVVYTPSVCIIVQGMKEVMLGDGVYRYAPGQFLAATVDLPVVGMVTKASVDQPYLTVQVGLDMKVLGDLLGQGGIDYAEAETTSRGLFVGRADEKLLDVTLRLMQLLDTPEDRAIMAPLLTREFHYRLLRSDYGRQIVQMVLQGSHMQRIGQVIAALKQDFAKALRMEDLADMARMSASTFHHHFKEVTAMSPLQYQKQLRLVEARKLMLVENFTAAHAAYNVGYESSSQFSREYVRMFGLPPAADVSRLRLG